MKTSGLSLLPKFFFAVIIMLTSYCSSSAKQEAVNNNNYALILDFYSIGTGVPNDQPLKDFISAYRKKNKLPELSATVVGGLGREGEYAIVFPLKELNAKQQKAFISSLSKALPTLKAKDEMGGINLSENKPFDMTRGRVEPKKVTM